MRPLTTWGARRSAVVAAAAAAAVAADAVCVADASVVADIGVPLGVGVRAAILHTREWVCWLAVVSRAAHIAVVLAAPHVVCGS